MSNNNNHPLGEAPWLPVIFSTGLGSGFCPVAPGTAGALLALLMWIPGYLWLSPQTLFWVLVAVIIVATIVGTWSSGIMEHYWGEDPRSVVIDEMVGVWIPLLAAPCGHYTWLLAIVSFAAFRLLDIFKPLGCRWVDNHVKGGWGIMADDILAGIYALIIVGALNLWLR